MSLVRIVNNLNSNKGKILINLSRISFAELKDKSIDLHFSNKLYDNNNKITLYHDTYDEADKSLTLIQKELNKYYKSK
jgi:hypothetical protein